MKKLLFAVVILSLLLTACGGKEEATNTPPPTAAPEATKAPEPAVEFQVGMISDVGGIDDASFNQTTWEGLDRADQELEGVAAQFLESQAQADYENNITEFAEQGYDMIVTVGFLLGDATAKMAAVYPDTMFAIIDYAYDPPIPNVQGIVFNTDEAAFLAGYLAAGMAVQLDPADPQIGWVGGMQIPPVEIFIVGYEAGMAYYNEQKGTAVKASGVYVGDFEAPDEGKAAANSLLDEGVDIIFGVGGKTGNGGLVAVRERADAGAAVAGIGVDVDQYFTLPTEKAILITSVEKKLDNAVFGAVKDAVEGNFGGGGVYVGTLVNDGVGLADYHDWADRIPADLQAEIEELREGVIAGTVSTGWPVGAEEPAVELPEGCAQDLTGETITLYHFGDLSAVYAFITQPLLAGLTDAIAYYNAQGGICGATIASEYADDGLNMEESQAIYDRFTAAEPPPLMFLLYGSPETELLRSQLAEDEIPAFTAGVSTLGLYGESGQEPLWAFANVPPYADQVGLFCEWVAETWDKDDPPKLAHLSWAGAFGEAAATEESTAYCESLGVEVVGAEYFAPGTPDLTAQIQSLMADGANILWTNALATGPVQVLNDAIALGVREDLMIAGPNWALDTSVIGLGGAASNGLIGVLPYVWWDETDHPGIQLITQQWLANKREIATRNIAYLLAWGTLDTYIELVKMAVAEVGYENLDGAAIKAQMEKLDYSSLEGVFTWTFSEEIRAPNQARIGQISFTAEGTPQILPLTDWMETPDLRPGGADVP